MVPKQAGQNQEVERVEKPAGLATDGPGTVQPYHGSHVRRGDGRPLDGDVVVIRPILNIIQRSRSPDPYIQGGYKIYIICNICVTFHTERYIRIKYYVL